MHPTTLTGGERLSVDASNNTVAEVVTVLGGAFSDSLVGGAAADTLTGNGGADTLTGGAGNDIITGGAGADAINPGAGIDHASGGAGNDTFTVSTFTDFKTTGGAETLDGGAGTDTISFTEAATLTITAPEVEALVGIETLDAADSITSNQTTITLGNGFLQVMAQIQLLSTVMILIILLLITILIYQLFQMVQLSSIQIMFLQLLMTQCMVVQVTIHGLFQVQLLLL